MKVILHIFVICSLLLSPSSGQAAEKVKVASIFAMTGTAAADHKVTIDGIRFAIRELNQQGGVLGKQIQLIEFDNRGTALHSKRAAENAVKAGVMAVFGASWSSHSLAMAPVLQAAQIPMISPLSTSPEVTRVGDYIFRVCFIDPFQGRIMAGFAVKDLHAKTAAILINANERYSEGLAAFFHKSFVRQGGRVVFETHYLSNTEDFSSDLKEITSLQPDVIFVPGNGLDSGRIIKQARDLGYAAPILGGDGWGGEEMYSQAGSALTGAYFSGHWHHQGESLKNRQFVKRYSKIYGAGEIGAAALAYDAVFLYADAAKRAGSLNPAKVRDSLAMTNNYKGLTGNITFDQHGDPIKSAVILKFSGKNTVYVKTIKP
jgi:branched-chain amino acid transport system substrate-binding protein